MPYPEQDGDRFYDSIAVADAGGALIANYRKTHLYGAAERRNYSFGQELPPVVEVNGVKTGVLNCYECDFPPLYQYLAEQGAQLVVGPTAAAGSTPRPVPGSTAATPASGARTANLSSPPGPTTAPTTPSSSPTAGSTPSPRSAPKATTAATTAWPPSRPCDRRSERRPPEPGTRCRAAPSPSCDSTHPTARTRAGTS
ncbi:nitrilase-related carbon-nitrogen hydrolase [Actinocorallia aurea]